VKNPAALQFLTQTGMPGTYYHTLFKGTSNMSQGLKILLPVIYTDLKWI
jgi:hypothetical protein